MVATPWVGVFGNILIAVFSIAAAFLALRGNRLQILQTNDVEDERRTNSLAAARAVLPAALSQICSSAMNNLRLHFASGHQPIGQQLPAVTEFQPLPESVISPIQVCIEHADGISQERLANVLRHFQVLQARHLGSETSLIEPYQQLADISLPLHNAISQAIGWAVIYALASDAFGFARGTEAAIPSTLQPDRVRGAFLLSGVVLELYPNLQQLLNGRIQGGRVEQDWAAS